MFFLKEQILHSLTALKNDENFQKHVHSIKKGRFKRDEQDPAYQSRMIYTEKLRSFVYNPALMNEVLSDETLKTLFFRSFGYQGNLNFRIYPDAWLRDLPLLDIGENCYLGDGVLLGTNFVSPDQKFLTVGPIKIGKNTIFNQRVTVGCDVEIGEDCRVGFNSTIGIRSKVGHDSIIEEYCFIGHGVKIGAEVKIGQYSHIGNMCIIEEGVNLENDSKIPPFSLITNNGIFNRRTGDQIFTAHQKQDLFVLAAQN